MPKQFEIFHINAFTNSPFEGNAAAVMFGDELSDHQMQRIANQTNYSETAFLISSDKASYKLRWFTPVKEVDLCGHATVASLHFLNEKGLFKKSDLITFETRSGILKCSINDNEYSLHVPVYPVQELSPQNRKEIIASFYIPDEIIDKNTPFFTLSNNFLFIKIKSYNQLISYNPDFNLDSQFISKFQDVSLYTTETIERQNAAYQRFFAPGCGITEDPVTGSASAYLGLVLQKAGFISVNDLKSSITIEQGDHLGRRGRVKVSFDPDSKELIISGHAVTFLKGSIFI